MGAELPLGNREQSHKGRKSRGVLSLYSGAPPTDRMSRLGAWSPRDGGLICIASYISGKLQDKKSFLIQNSSSSMLRKLQALLAGGEQLHAHLTCVSSMCLVCVHVYAHLCMCEVHVCLCNQRATSSLPQLLSTLFTQSKVLGLVKAGLTDLAHQACLPGRQHYRQISTPAHFSCGFWDVTFSTHVCMSNPLYPLSHLPKPSLHSCQLLLQYFLTHLCVLGVGGVRR